MTAREKAREAAKGLWTSGWHYRAAKCADAANDVWEPIVAGLLEVIEAELGDNPPYDDVREAKAALGARRS
jgi:hypothetical protein